VSLSQQAPSARTTSTTMSAAIDEVVGFYPDKVSDSLS